MNKLFPIVSALMCFGLAECIEGDCKNGKGTFNYDNGDVYNGEWAEGVYEALGTLVSQEFYYQGFFKSGKKHRWGKLEFFEPEGLNFFGEWDMDVMKGLGIWDGLEEGYALIGVWDEKGNLLEEKTLKEVQDKYRVFVKDYMTKKYPDEKMFAE